MRSFPHRLGALYLVGGVILVSIFGALTQYSLASALALSLHHEKNAAFAPAASPIKHIVFMVKENRTFDSMFGTFPGATGATTYRDTSGSVRQLAHQPDHLNYDISHSWHFATQAIDNGKMDKFSLTRGAIQTIQGKKTDFSDSQYYQEDIPNYWRYAENFALADHFFSEVRGPSFPNHLWTIAGDTDDIAADPFDNHGLPNHIWGCDGPSGVSALQIHPDGTRSHIFPCLKVPTLADSMDKAGISWRYYAPGYGDKAYMWSTFDAISRIRNGPEWKTNVVPHTQFAGDAANGKLPAVSWLVQTREVSDHPPFSICAGEDWTVQQINAIMHGPDWSSTAIVLVWDDWGGLYDHIVPPKGPNPQIQYGLRVPMIMISPYAKKTIVPTLFSFSSMLKFAESTFNLPALTKVDGQANDLAAMLDFSQSPRSPLILQTRMCPHLNLPESVQDVDE